MVTVTHLLLGLLVLAAVVAALPGFVVFCYACDRGCKADLDKDKGHGFLTWLFGYLLGTIAVSAVIGGLSVALFGDFFGGIGFWFAGPFLGSLATGIVFLRHAGKAKRPEGEGASKAGDDDRGKAPDASHMLQPDDEKAEPGGRKTVMKDSYDHQAHLFRTVRGRSTSELIAMLVDGGDWTPEARVAARDVLRERGLSDDEVARGTSAREAQSAEAKGTRWGR